MDYVIDIKVLLQVVFLPIIIFVAGYIGWTVKYFVRKLEIWQKDVADKFMDIKLDISGLSNELTVLKFTLSEVKLTQSKRGKTSYREDRQ